MFHPHTERPPGRSILTSEDEDLILVTYYPRVAEYKSHRRGDKFFTGFAGSLEGKTQYRMIGTQILLPERIGLFRCFLLEMKCLISMRRL